MLSMYRQHRKDYVFLVRSRRIQAQINEVAKEVFAMSNPNPITRAKFEELQSQSHQLNASMDAGIPKIVKILPVK